jgi:hypothetical protein
VAVLEPHRLVSWVSQAVKACIQASLCAPEPSTQRDAAISGACVRVATCVRTECYHFQVTGVMPHSILQGWWRHLELHSAAPSCRPFSGGKLLHAHLCGRLPRDTLVVSFSPDVPGGPGAATPADSALVMPTSTTLVS